MTNRFNNIIDPYSICFAEAYVILARMLSMIINN